ncbi:hypothetical protein [Erythrobacter dokdonensis]|uniref:Uncharacterized protein n=1 Tax=Erythrobacter dokdonensis DSW-74 TaxID=1300349 RepID=A0A1A7BI88_9SPHN|nr:hypothetical protein [Erythrobacter dokdonensis]OBV10915.1 hypothetical protein I603_1323 [Erythrobacter dokdonensis DSW-74]
MRFSNVKCAAASVAAIAMAAAPVAAKKADSLRDLLGSSGASAETQLQQRGFEYISGNKTENASNSYWWDARGKDCVVVEVMQGRVVTINDAKAEDCGHKSGNDTAVAAAAIGAVALGAILLSRKDKDKHKDQYQQDWQEVEVHNTQSGKLRIFRKPDKNARVREEVREGTMLRNYGCDRYNSETWCEVRTMNGRTEGWARDRYLRVTDNYPGNGWGGSGNTQFGDLIGNRAPGAQNEMRQRGFRQVDGFKTGQIAYTIWFRNASRQCVQMAVANGRVDSIVDIRAHPKCR